MSILPQPSLFSWQFVDRSPEIVRLARLLDALPDRRLLAALCARRPGRKNEYPPVALWRCVVAFAFLGHPTLASFIRELRRNAELRQICGLEPAIGEAAVPPDHKFSRFFNRLSQLRDLVAEVFENLLDSLGELLPDLATNLAADSKALHARGPLSSDADQGTKSYQSVREDGTAVEKTLTWFGWKLHLLVDADYELPLSFELTKASTGDSPRLMPLVEHLEERHPRLAARAKTLAADKAYDDGQDKADLWNNHAIAPLIPPRDTTALRGENPMQPLDPQRHDAIFISPTGKVSCLVRPFDEDRTKAYAPMQFMGFEAGRDSLKFRCPAAAYGVECQNRDACQCQPTVRDGEHGRIVRVALERDPRVLMPIHFHSRTFAHAYKKRTSVERFFSRVDNVHGFEHAIVKSRARMQTRIALTLIATLATARAWIEAKQGERMRSMRQTA